MGQQVLMRLSHHFSFCYGFQGEEFAGSPLMCQAAGQWHLVGVAAWRKGCSASGQRPRLYDKVSWTVRLQCCQIERTFSKS